MNIKRWFASLLMVLTVIVSLGFVKFQQIQAAIAFGESFPEPSASVQSTRTEAISFARSIKVVGQLRATQEMVIRNEFAGEITLVGFTPGEVVPKGRLLMRIDTRIDEADLKAAKSRLKLAQLTYQRVKKLLAQNRVSEDEVDAAEAEIAVTKSEVENLEVIIAKKNIRAQFAGRVGLNEYQTGELLVANSDITTLIGTSTEIWVDFAVPQTLPQPHLGDTVGLEVVARTNERYEAKVIAQDPFIDIGSRQQSYRAVLSNEKGKLQHNQLVSVYVSEPEMSVVVVPTNAIKRNHFGDFVYRLEQDEQQNWRAKVVKVELGEKIRDQQIILSGLATGEFIATEGVFKLQENLLVYTDADADADADAAIGGSK